MSPNDTRIAVEVNADVGATDIWVYEIENDVFNQVTFDGGDRPLWSSDGTEITFRRGQALWTVPTDFSGTPTFLSGTEALGNNGPGSWSPDGAALLFASDVGIHLWDSAPEDPSETAEIIVPSPDTANLFLPEFSPDGTWFVYVSRETGTFELYANPYPSVGPGGRQRITTDGGFSPTWVRERQELIFESLPSVLQAMAIATQPTLSRSNPVPLFSEQTIGGIFSTGGRRNFDITADGQRLVVLADAVANDEEGQESPQIYILLNWFEELKERVPVP